MGSGVTKLAGKTDKELQETFKQADKDTSGKVDNVELISMLEDLEIGDDASREKMLTDWLIASYVDDGDNQLNFQEFKNFVKYCGEKAKGKNPKAPVKGKDSKALDPETEKLRKEAAERRAKERAEAAAKLAAENRERKKKLAEVKGKDSKSLSSETEAARLKKAQESKAAHEQHKKDDLEHSNSLKASVAAQTGRDQKSLSAETEEERKKKAEESKEVHELHKKEDLQHKVELDKLVKSTEAIIDDGDGHQTSQTCK